MAACVWASLPGVARAQGTADQAVTAAQREGEFEHRVPWHDSTALWVNRISTWTTGVGGEDQQTANPYYDMVFYLRPRYYLWENERLLEKPCSMQELLEAVDSLLGGDASSDPR